MQKKNNNFQRSVRGYNDIHDVFVYFTFA